MRRAKSYIALGFAAVFTLGLALLVWSAWIEPSRVTFKTYPIAVAGWPPALTGYEIAFITDVHVGSPHITLAKLHDVVAQTNARWPDLVLLGGDYVIQGVVGGRPVPSREIVTELARLRAKDGVYGVLGNHDWWDDARRMDREFAERGLPSSRTTRAGSSAARPASGWSASQTTWRGPTTFPAPFQRSPAAARFWC